MTRNSCSSACQVFVSVVGPVRNLDCCCCIFWWIFSSELTCMMAAILAVPVLQMVVPKHRQSNCFRSRNVCLSVATTISAAKANISVGDIHSTILIPGLGADPLRAHRAGPAFRSLARPTRSTGQKKIARQSDCARVRVFPPDLARPDAPRTPGGRSGAQFSNQNDGFFDVCRFGCARFPTTSRPLRNIAWAHEFQASGLS